MRRMLLGLFLLSCAASTEAAEMAGNWITQDRSAVVTIAPCGNFVCGSIARIIAQQTGIPKTDIKSPDKSLRGRPLIELRILSGFSRNGDRLESGRIYDPESGKSYRSRLRPNADGSLGVSGRIAFFCQTQRWTRAR